jgi:hypothetical protein
MSLRSMFITGVVALAAVAVASRVPAIWKIVLGPPGA